MHVQGYFAHTKQPPPLGPPYAPRHMLVQGPVGGWFLMREVPLLVVLSRGVVRRALADCAAALELFDIYIYTQIDTVGHRSLLIGGKLPYANPTCKMGALALSIGSLP